MVDGHMAAAAGHRPGVLTAFTPPLLQPTTLPTPSAFLRAACKQKFSLLGSTGSIGTQTLDIVAEHPDKFAVTALAAGGNVELLAEQVGRAGGRDAAGGRCMGNAGACREGWRRMRAPPLALPSAVLQGHGPGLQRLPSCTLCQPAGPAHSLIPRRSSSSSPRW